MINRFCTVIGLPLVAALTIVMCGSARSLAAGVVPQQNVAADGSRRILSVPQTAPTNVSAYPGTKSPGQIGEPIAKSASANEAKPGAGEKTCTEHNLPEAECGICHPERAATLKPGEGSKVRMPSADSANLVGVELAQATVGDISEGIECYAELAFNQNRLAQIAAPVGGILQSVAVDLGTKVEEKQTLAKIWSAAIAEAVA